MTSPKDFPTRERGTGWQMTRYIHMVGQSLGSPTNLPWCVLIKCSFWRPPSQLLQDIIQLHDHI